MNSSPYIRLQLLLDCCSKTVALRLLCRKTLEYGCSSDPIVQLFDHIRPGPDTKTRPGPQPVLLLQTDQCGLLHAPSGAASCVVEHGLGDLIVALHGF